MRKAESEDLGNGFSHHGMATPISNHRGTVATVDGDGRNVVLVWLLDHTGGYALLCIDAETGDTRQIPMPFPFGGDCPYASILSTRNRFYTHFNSHFCEFDPATCAFTFFQKTEPQMAMSMTEDDDGRIWSATYPDSGVVCFDPASGKLRDYGHVYDQNWRQYPRSIAADDQGWIYFGVGATASQIIVLDPETGDATPVLAEEERGKSHAHLQRDLDGKVYGISVPGSGDDWYVFHGGEWEKIGALPQQNVKPIITDSQGLFHREFPDGRQIVDCDLVDKILVVEGPGTAARTKVSFTYTSEGAHVMGLAAAPDGTICGGTAFPMRFFSFDPRQDTWVNRASHGQWNTVARHGDRFFVGGYGGGFLLEWNPATHWVPTDAADPTSNPRFHMQVTPTIHRPHDLLAHPDGKTVVLAGTPGYGYTGGGLLFWDRETESHVLVEHTDILPEHSTMSLIAIPDGKLLGGSTVNPGTGGEQKAEEAELYIMDLASKEIDWHATVFPGVHGYTDLCPGPGNLAFGFADASRFFVFDTAKRSVVHEEEMAGPDGRLGSTANQQGPRVFVTDSDGTIYILFTRGIAKLDQASYEITMLAESPVPVRYGGDILDGRIYFADGSHVYSYWVPQ